LSDKEQTHCDLHRLTGSEYTMITRAQLSQDCVVFIWH